MFKILQTMFKQFYKVSIYFTKHKFFKIYKNNRVFNFYRDMYTYTLCAYRHTCHKFEIQIFK